MTIRQSHALRRQPVDVGRLDLATVTAEIGVARIIEHDEQNIWTVFGFFRGL